MRKKNCKQPERNICYYEEMKFKFTAHDGNNRRQLPMVCYLQSIKSKINANLQFYINRNCPLNVRTK